uniref:Solute carrier organic anion transporter family member n=1 Tax=Amblyomma aureolatum TaxID=187763 RepID=A0A1E1XJ76_9ACAR
MNAHKQKPDADGGGEKVAPEGAISMPASKDAPASHGSKEDVEDDSDYLCGVGSYRPNWLQRFATSRYYALVFGLLGIFQGAYRTYLVGTLSTVERRFSLSSRASGVIMIADDLSPIVANVFMMVWLRRTSKPNWVSGGMLFSLLGVLSSMLPYFVYGPGKHLLVDVHKVGGATAQTMQFCGTSDQEAAAASCQATKEDTASVGPLIFFFMGNFLNGLGSTAYYVIGTTYMDDNVKKKHSAVYFGSLYVFRLLGPVLGFTLASLSLSYPEEMTKDAPVQPGDPRWVGAWWFGYIFIGLGIVVSTLPMLFFPKKIRSKSEANKEDAVSKGKSLRTEIREGLQGLGRLARNPVYVFRLLGAIASYIALAGYYISFPRYTQHQFSQTASKASLLAGPTYILSNVVGIILGAIFVHKVRPTPRVVGIHTVVVALIAAVGITSLMAINCGSIQYPVVPDAVGGLSIQNQCSDGCDCSTRIHRPVCDPVTGTQYFSACFAGCPTSVSNHTGFDECLCLQSEPGMNRFTQGSVTNGKCDQDCFDAMVIFAAVVFVIQVGLGTTHVGSTLIMLRCIEPRDKSLSLLTLSALMNAFAFIPYPLIYGALTDASCIVWEDRCGERGSCWLYDLKKLRYLIHGVTTALLVAGCVLQACMAYHCKRIQNFYDDEEDADAKRGEKSGAAAGDGVQEPLRQPGSEAQELHAIGVGPEHRPRTRTTSIDSWEFQNFNQVANVTK